MDSEKEDTEEDRVVNKTVHHFRNVDSYMLAYSQFRKMIMKMSDRSVWLHVKSSLILRFITQLG